MKHVESYKGPIIEIRGVVRLFLAAVPFLFAAYFVEDRTLWGFGFIIATFATAGFIGIDTEHHRAPRYVLWVGAFLLLATYSAWVAAEHPWVLIALLVVWSLLSSISFAAGPVASLPVNIGCIVYVLLLLGQRLENQSFAELAVFTFASVGWAYVLGRISWLQGRKNTLVIPNVRHVLRTMKGNLTWDSTYTRTGIVRGLLMVAVAFSIPLFGGNKALIITLFTILIAMQPGRGQTIVSVASRVAAAIGAVAAAAFVFNANPPYWLYIFIAVGILVFTRWVILRKYTYNSFFLITFPLFVLSLAGYSAIGPNKIWYTLLGGAIAIIASELVVFRDKSKSLHRSDIDMASAT